jgi:hypothetical protein
MYLQVSYKKRIIFLLPLSHRRKESDPLVRGADPDSHQMSLFYLALLIDCLN